MSVKDAQMDTFLTQARELDLLIYQPISADVLHGEAMPLARYVVSQRPWYEAIAPATLRCD